MVFGKKSKGDDTQPDQWKKKYYDSLDDLEYKEEQWHKVEKLLRNAIVRISLASDPAHERLTKQLNILREDIRNGKNSLNLSTQLDKVIGIIRDLETEDADDDPGNNYSAKKLVEECINRIKWSEKAQQFKRGLSRQFNNLKDDEVQKFIHSYTKLLNQEFVWFEEEIESNKGLNVPEDKTTEKNSQRVVPTNDVVPPAELDIIKHNKVAPENISPEKTSPEINLPEKNLPEKKLPDNKLTVEYSALLLTLLKNIPDGLISPSQIRQLQLKATSSKTRQQAIETIEAIACNLGVPSSETDNDPAAYSKEAVNVLIEFLELISLPDELSTKAEAIRQTLIVEPDKLKSCLTKTVELVMTLQVELKNERKELETFLAELSTRLEEIDEEVRKLSGIGEKRDDNLNKMNSNLNDATNSIDAFLNEDTSIDVLKDNVKSHVIMIRHHMDTYFTEDKTQQSYSDAAVQQLAKDLIAVKREAEDLREQLEQKRLQATHDTLTRIPNRLAYDEWISQEHERFEKYDTPFVLMVWDVDFFKRVNDEFGHQAGDKVLRIVAQMLSENIRDADFVARYGGEEFVIVLPGTTQAAAMKISENIRLAIESCAFHFRDKPVKVTASAGVCEIQKNETVDSLFERADKALYKAKSSGRNTCIAG